MHRNERTQDPTEALRMALEGKQAELWTALPGTVESFDPVAMTLVVQPTIKGRIENEQGKIQEVNLPLLVDVPVLFPSGGGFTLTHPIKKGAECLVIFASRCIDGWWLNGGIGSTPDLRMHDLSDGFAYVGPRSQPRKLDPAVDADNVQLRTDDGEAHITMMPDYTIRAQNPEATVILMPDGTIEAKNSATSVVQTPSGSITATADGEIILSAPSIKLEAASISWAGKGGGSTIATLTGDMQQIGSHRSTGDQVAGGISQINHTHPGDSGGQTGKPL